MFDLNTKNILIECLNRQIRLYEQAGPTGGAAGGTAAPTAWSPPTPDQIKGTAGGNPAPAGMSAGSYPSGLAGPSTGPAGQPVPYGMNAGIGIAPAAGENPSANQTGIPGILSSNVTNFGNLSGGDVTTSLGLIGAGAIGGPAANSVGQLAGSNQIPGAIGQIANIFNNNPLFKNPYGQQLAKNLIAASGGERAAQILADMPRRSANILVTNLGYTPAGSWAEQDQYAKPTYTVPTGNTGGNTGP